MYKWKTFIQFFISKTRSKNLCTSRYTPWTRMHMSVPHFLNKFININNNILINIFQEIKWIINRVSSPKQIKTLHIYVLQCEFLSGLHSIHMITRTWNIDIQETKAICNRKHEVKYGAKMFLHSQRNKGTCYDGLNRVAKPEKQWKWKNI